MTRLPLAVVIRSERRGPGSLPSLRFECVLLSRAALLSLRLSHMTRATATHRRGVSWEDEYWPALICVACSKSLAVLRISEAGLAVIPVDRKGAALPADLNLLNKIAFGDDKRQLDLVVIEGLAPPHEPDVSLGRYPKSYEIRRCNRRCERHPARISAARLTAAAEAASAERRDVVVGVHL